MSFCVSWKVNKGSAPPSFTLKDQDGKNVSLSDFKGKPTVVYFYPADESPGCTKQVLFFPSASFTFLTSYYYYYILWSMFFELLLLWE